MAQALSGPELVARITTLEGIVKVLIKREIGEDGVEAFDDIAKELEKSAHDRTDAQGHDEVSMHSRLHVEKFLEEIRTELNLGATS